MSDGFVSIPGCPSTTFEVILSFSLSIMIFLVGFPFTGVALTSLYVYKNKQMKSIFKITFILNILIFWIIFIIVNVGYYYCYEMNIMNKNLNSMNVIIFGIIVATLLIIQFGCIHLNAILRYYYTFYGTIYSFKKSQIVVGVLFSIFKLSIYELVTLCYVISHINGYQKYRIYTAILAIIGEIIGIPAHLVMLLMFVKKLILIVKMKNSVVSSIKNDKQGNDAPMIMKYETKNDTFTIKTHTQVTQPMLSLYSFDNSHTNEMELNKYDNTIKTASKLVTLTLTGYILLFLFIASIIFIGFNTKYDNITSLFIGYVIIFTSLMIKMYTYFHFSFSNEYYNYIFCFVYFDKKIICFIQGNYIKNIL